MRAIIVDDEPDGIKTLNKMLSLSCKQVEVVALCTSAEEGKLKIIELTPDLIFLDIQMPGKSGFELLAELNTDNMEVIFVTAHNQYMLQALQFSATDYLLKPIDEDRLIDAIKRVEKKATRKGRLQKCRNAALQSAKGRLPQRNEIVHPHFQRVCHPEIGRYYSLRIRKELYHHSFKR